MNLKKKLISASTIIILSVSPMIFAIDVTPKGNSTWIYDVSYDSNGRKGDLKEGYFVPYLNAYNKDAGIGHEITQLFIYGGDISCPSLLDLNANYQLLNSSTASYINFYPFNISLQLMNWNSFIKANLTENGLSSSQFYNPGKQFPQKSGNYLVTDLSGVQKAIYKILIIDGYVGTGGGAETLNMMTEEQARAFADKLSAAICSDQSVDGIQFDIEPFSFTGEGGAVVGEGQKFFYQEISKNLAGWYGKNYYSVSGINSDYSSDPIHAVSPKHPNGRFFSIFASAGKITFDVKDIFNKFGNFYVIVPLYDLDSTLPGQSTPIVRYKTLVTSQISKISASGIPFQLALPASASVHEFETMDGIPSGVKQLDYVKVVVNIVNSLNIKSNPNFKGMALWCWSLGIWWKGHKFEPSYPLPEEISYLQKNL